MRGIILAGGHGTRLKPMTTVTNKHLIAVYDKPMIEYPIATLVGAGIKDVLIVSGREHAGHFLEYLGSGIDRGLKFTYKVQEEAGGIAQALGLAEDFSNGDRVTVILGDNYFEADKLAEYNVAGKEDWAKIYLKKVSDPERFGIAVIKDKQVQALIEKPKVPVSDLAVTGLYIYPNDVFNIIKTLVPSDRGELEITDVNNYYLREGRLGYSILETFWSDMGTPESLGKTIQWIMKEK